MQPMEAAWAVLKDYQQVQQVIDPDDEWTGWEDCPKCEQPSSGLPAEGVCENCGWGDN